MSNKTRRSLIGLLLWMTPAVTFVLVDQVIHKGGSWWLWLPIVAGSIGFNALLDCYVSESYRAAVSEAMEG